MAIDAFISHLSYEKKYSPHTVKAYKKDLEDFSDFLNAKSSGLKPEGATYSEIREWIVNLVEEGMGNRSVNRKVTSLKSYYKFLLRIGEVQSNPLSRHKALKTPKKAEVPFSEGEMKILLNDIPFEEDFEGIRDRLIIELFYTTGMRRSELINLKVSDLDLSSRTVRVLGKRNKERIIPLLPGTMERIREYLPLREEQLKGRESQSFFITHKGNKVYETLVYRIINGYFSRVSTKVKKSPHILRHTFATHMLSQGADLNSVKELLGHSSLASTQVYTHNSIAELKKVHSRTHPRNRE